MMRNSTENSNELISRMCLNYKRLEKQELKLPLQKSAELEANKY